MPYTCKIGRTAAYCDLAAKKSIRCHARVKRTGKITHKTNR
jgi:hypothetical protein